MQTDVEAGLQPPAASADAQRFSRDASGEFISEKPAKPEKGQHLAPSERFTGHQLFYIFALDGFGGMAISAGVNFAIAYGESNAPFQVMILVWGDRLTV